LIQHSPQTLCETYWKANELEKGILVKKSLMPSSSTYTKSTTSYPTYPCLNHKPCPNLHYLPNKLRPTILTPSPQPNKFLLNQEKQENVGAAMNLGLQSIRSDANSEKQVMPWPWNLNISWKQDNKWRSLIILCFSLTLLILLIRTHLNC
jgi:hypothetical protein